MHERSYGCITCKYVVGKYKFHTKLITRQHWVNRSCGNAQRLVIIQQNTHRVLALRSEIKWLHRKSGTMWIYSKNLWSEKSNSSTRLSNRKEYVALLICDYVLGVLKTHQRFLKTNFMLKTSWRIADSKILLYSYFWYALLLLVGLGASKSQKIARKETFTINLYFQYLKLYFIKINFCKI